MEGESCIPRKVRRIEGNIECMRLYVFSFLELGNESSTEQIKQIKTKIHPYEKNPHPHCQISKVTFKIKVHT
jgi:hypothetical protein